MTDTRREGGEYARLEAVLDRVEDRFHDATPGLNRLGSPATREALGRCGLPRGAALLWGRWDGLDLGSGEARILPLGQLDGATQRARDEGRLQAGDRVIGGRGRDLFVLPADPWEEGADVVLVEETGERWPDATSIAHLVLGLLGEIAVLIDDEGEFREDLFGDDGELTQRAERRVLRRRLDLDPDAPAPRYRLAVALRRAGEARAARSELNRVLKAAPELAWAHHERGRALLDLGAREDAARSFVRASEILEDADLRAHFLAWAALATGSAAHAAAARACAPAFSAHAAAGVQELVAREQVGPARELLALGLAVQPGNVELLALRDRLGD